MSQLILILGLLGLICLYFVFTKKEKKTKKKTGAEMVKCQTCGVNIPKSEAIGLKDVWFCSEEHKA